jgi:hypothetical protein
VVGQQLACGQGGWAGDLLGGFLFRAPRSFAHQWLRDGAEIGGATMSSFTPTEAGSYACRVTATNQAGSAAQMSAAVQVSAPAQVSAPSTPIGDIEFGRITRNTKKGTAFLTVIVPAGGQIGYRGKGEGTSPGSSGAVVSRDLAAAGPLKLKVKPGRFGKRSKKIRRQLKGGSGRAKVKIFVTFVPQGGTANTRAKKLKLVRK